MKRHLNVMVIYDGFGNSVFHSQVFTPFSARRDQKPNEDYLIISFEKVPLSHDAYSKYFGNMPPMHTKILHKDSFWGAFSLSRAIKQLRSVLNQCNSYSIIARGPLAGFISAYAIDTRHCTSLVIQARGLLAQEYRYHHAQKADKKKIWQFIHKIRSYQYKSLEKTVYGLRFPDKIRSLISLESVSHALTEYLVTHYGANPAYIRTPLYDFVIPIKNNIRLQQRVKIRYLLRISPTAYVYCYSGSCHAWQCPVEVAAFFAQRISSEPYSILLILTLDGAFFENLLKEYAIPPQRYRLLSVLPHDVMSYLYTADAGLLFREPHIINWVSRPTKILEYHAARLKIIHNGTVAYLNHHNASKKASFYDTHAAMPHSLTLQIKDAHPQSGS